ncbi:MAG: N-acetylmuramoyl-L-alanine amidase [Crocinitomicaceae bacterium]|nr:N-acetylmuramoyl-L-alanine amidase [Crocinitomicaceae bacterium]
MRIWITLVSVFIAFGNCLTAQVSFQEAYAENSLVPHGLLEAVAWTNTHMVHLENQQASCSGMPSAFGIMGLHEDGKYFTPTGILAANASGISITQQKGDPQKQILAYARLFNTTMAFETMGNNSNDNPKTIKEVLYAISEIPNDGIVNQYARDAQAYSIFEFMMNEENAAYYNFPVADFNLTETFGTSNYAVLSSERVQFTATGISSSSGAEYYPSQNKSTQYGPAIWNPAATCNFSSRSGVAISAITIHTIQGTYAGAISWAQNCSSSVSYHYVIRSSDGQVTQMVLEEDKAWHVGSENPYTIGYEHEGFVNDPSWYTEELYNASADLSRDIVNSGYGIPPLRTFYGAASVGTNLLGGCTKIKGHQHYPNQSHTDPGIYWDWEKYYRLINNNPTFNTIASTSGNLYDTGGPTGDYQDDEREFWLIQPPNAQDITLDFTVFNVESGYDNLFIYDGDNIDAPLVGSYTGSNSPGTVVSSGGSLLIEFRSDCSTISNGWEANYTTTSFDLTPPTTVITPGNVWYTDDFTVDFSDSDTQSPIAERFYLNATKSPADNDWSANGNYGFSYETFEDSDANWFGVTGTYSVISGAYSINDVAEQNSNVYIGVDQTNGIHLYEWNQTITSNDVSQRAGVHFMCDNPNLPNRGNSYFVYLRESDDKVQIYSVDNDIINLETESDLTINSGQTYNCKVWFDAATGWIKVYVDHVLLASWHDPTPLTSGGFISLRTGGCDATFDDIRVYQNRTTSVDITAGTSDEFYIESENATSTGMVQTIVIDAAENWSGVVTENYLLDFTPPSIDFLHDGNLTDIDTFMVSTIEANWLATDIHSDIAEYEVAIGTLPNLDDVYPWTSNGLSEAFSTVLSSPIYNQVYHISVRAINNAGLSDQFVSDGQRFIDDLGLLESALIHIEVFPNPATDFISITNAPDQFEVILIDQQGKVCMHEIMSSEEQLDVSTLSNGSYQLIIQVEEAFIVKQVVVQ